MFSKTDINLNFKHNIDISNGVKFGQKYLFQNGVKIAEITSKTVIGLYIYC